MADGLRSTLISDPEWGEVKLLFPIPRPDDLWGSLSPLRGTLWGDQIPAVSGESLSHAFHGWATPLMREIGVEPLAHARRIPLEQRTCEQADTCLTAGRHCRPGPRTPRCWDPVGLSGSMADLVRTVVLAWSEGRYVVVVEGSEFSLL
jgi:hypothetical protein